MKGLLVVAIIALMAGSALADPDVLPVKGARYATYNLVTGELTVTEAPTRLGRSIWAAVDSTPWYFGSYSHGWTVLDWGDAGGPVTVGGFVLAYGTDLVPPERIDAVVAFYGDEDGFNSSNRTFLAAYVIPNLPTGFPDAASAWIITVDIDTPAWWFTLAGNDLDGDGLADFGYTHWFRNLPAHSATGPVIASEPNLVPSPAPGVVSGFDAFRDPNLAPGSYVGTYWFG